MENRRLHDRDHGVLAGARQLGPVRTVAELRERVLAHLLFVQNLKLVRDLHRDGLGEEVLTHSPLDLALGLGQLLFLLRGVLQGPRRSTVATRLDLFVESHRHVGLLELRGQLAEPRLAFELRLVVVNGVRLHLRVDLHENAFGIRDDQRVEHRNAGVGRLVLLLSFDFLVDIDEHGTLREGLVVGIAVLLLLDFLEVVLLVELLLLDHVLEVVEGLLVLVLLREHVVQNVPLLRLLLSELLQNVFLQLVVGVVELLAAARLGAAVDILRHFEFFDLLERILVEVLGVLRQVRVLSQGQVVHLAAQNLILQVSFEIRKARARNNVSLEKLGRLPLLNVHFVLVFS